MLQEQLQIIQGLSDLQLQIYKRSPLRTAFIHTVYETAISPHENPFFVDYLDHSSLLKLELVKVRETKTSIQFRRAPKFQGCDLALWVQESMRKISDSSLLVACVGLAIHNPLLLSDQESASRQPLLRVPWCHQTKRNAVWISTSWILHPENLEYRLQPRVNQSWAESQSLNLIWGTCL